MHDTFLKMYVKLQNLTNSEQGQDLVEYALLLTMVSLVLVSGIRGIATAVNTVFNTVSSSLA